MAKASGQPEHLNICYRCGAAVKWEDKVAIKEYIAERDPKHPNISSNHIERVVGLTNVCKKCYKEYQKMMETFLEGA